MRMYYETIKVLGDTTNIAYWAGDNSKATALVKKFNFDFIRPLGTKKPRNVSRETIMEF